jgi:hypothetical protein
MIHIHTDQDAVEEPPINQAEAHIVFRVVTARQRFRTMICFAL